MFDWDIVNASIKLLYFHWMLCNTKAVVTDQKWAVSSQEVWSNMYLFKTWQEILKPVNLACTYDRLRLCIQSAIKAQGMSIKTECTQLYCPHLSVSCHLKAWEYPSYIGWQEKTVFLRRQVELRQGISQTWTDTKHLHCRQMNLITIIIMTALQTQLLTLQVSICWGIEKFLDVSLPTTHWTTMAEQHSKITHFFTVHIYI